MPEGSKSIFTSKTFWANIVGLVAMILQGTTGSEILVPIETQGVLLTMINILLRSITKDSVTWQ